MELFGRYGYRRILLVALSLMASGYFAAGYMSTYAAVFLALPIMGTGLRSSGPRGWVLIVGHRATHYALDRLLNGVPLCDAMKAPQVGVRALAA